MEFDADGEEKKGGDEKGQGRGRKKREKRVKGNDERSHKWEDRRVDLRERWTR